jgi:hypothetical protein
MSPSCTDSIKALEVLKARIEDDRLEIRRDS